MKFSNGKNTPKIHSVSFASFYHFIFFSLYIRPSAISCYLSESFGGKCLDQFIVKRGGFLGFCTYSDSDMKIYVYS